MGLSGLFILSVADRAGKEKGHRPKPTPLVIDRVEYISPEPSPDPGTEVLPARGPFR